MSPWFHLNLRQTSTVLRSTSDVTVCVPQFSPTDFSNHWEIGRVSLPGLKYGVIQLDLLLSQIRSINLQHVMEQPNPESYITMNDVITITLRKRKGDSMRYRDEAWYHPPSIPVFSKNAVSASFDDMQFP